MIITIDFISAIKDYQYLLSRNYTAKTLLKVVSNRYKLNNVERTLLYRGVTTQEKSNARIMKTIVEKDLFSHNLSIDAYNVLLTINSYLTGKIVFLAMDGYVRDAAGMRNKIAKTIWYRRAVELTIRYLKAVNLADITFCVDSKVADSLELSNYIISVCEQYSVKTIIEQYDNVDKYLIDLDEGIIASSDSEIIDNSKSKIFDLAKNILMFHYNANLLNLNAIITSMT